MKVRIHTQERILETVTLNNEQTHYISKVMRLKPRDNLYLFNKNDGEFLCEIINIKRSSTECKVLQNIRLFEKPKVELTCVYSIIKPKNVETIIQKCTEVGVTCFIPLETSRTVQANLNFERLEKIAIEASEQSGRLDIPMILEPVKIIDIKKITQNFETILLHQNGKKEHHFTQSKRCIIIGPEGGFTNEELNTMKEFTKVKISENILRAETAAILGCGLALL